MVRSQSMDQVVAEALGELIRRHGRTPSIAGSTNLQSLGLESVDGVEFACIAEECLGFKIPPDVNPFRHPSGNRLRTVDELKASLGNETRGAQAREGEQG